MNLAYSHTQFVPSTSWTVLHNLGHKPISDVLVDINGTLQKMLPLEVIHVSDNELQINFTEARAGSARLV